MANSPLNAVSAVHGFAGRRSVLFAYWGTKGALSQFTLQLAREASCRPDVACTFSLSSSNELWDEYQFLKDRLFQVDTFASKWLSLNSLTRLGELRRRLRQRLVADRVSTVVTLMPHIWSPLIVRSIRNAGARYISVIHDADSHPGDRYGLVHRWLLRDAYHADHVVTLSKSVAARLTARGIPAAKISVLFLPDMNYEASRIGARPVGIRPGPAEPLRVLFLGRILPYKGLDLLVEAIALLRAEGLAVTVGVFGAGHIDSGLRGTLDQLGAEVNNRWLRHDEFGPILSRYDVVAACHTEASQSGVIAAAFGSGLPVVATPVGGLTEQVMHGVTGLLADKPTARSVACAIRSLAIDRALLDRLRDGVAATRASRSMGLFFDEIIRIALDGVTAER